MANRMFVQNRFSLEKNVVELWAKVDIGATGAPTLSILNSKGIASIARNDVGKYTLTLDDTYYKFLFMDFLIANADGLPASQDLGIVSEDVGGDKTIVFQLSDDESAEELEENDVLYLHVVLSNSGAL